MMDQIVAGLVRRGYVENQSVQLQRHYGQRDKQLLAQAAANLAKWRPNVIVSLMTHADIAVLQATEQLGTPIVCWSMDPLDSGLVSSMQRPGGRLTGLAFPPGLAWIQLRALKILLPGALKLGYLHNPGYAPALGALQKLKEASAMFGISLDIREVVALDAIQAAITDIKQAGSQALMVGPHELFNSNGQLIGCTALAQGMLAIGQESVCKGGGVAAFMPDFPRIWDAAADMAVRILRGADPASMPIDRHIAPLMILNPGAARALGLQIPKLFLDEASSRID